MDRKATHRLLNTLNGRQVSDTEWRVGGYVITSYDFKVYAVTSDDEDSEDMVFYAESLGEALLWVAERLSGHA